MQAQAYLRLVRSALFSGVIVVDLLYLVNCMAPYLGLKYEFSQVMYSGLHPSARNHLLVEPLDPFGQAAYVRIDLGGPSVPSPRHEALAAFIQQAQADGHELHLGFLRRHFDVICEETRGAPLFVSYRTGDGRRHRLPDVCADTTFIEPPPSGLYPPCSPDCSGLLQEWAREGPEGLANDD